MRRQAMQISIKDLRDKADELEKELSEMELLLSKDLLTQRCVVPIINNTKASDTWEFE